MRKIQQAILFLNHFSLGLIVPILNLILLDRGATLQTLPLLIAIFAVTVLCFELPSGICADLLGRKTVFLISCIFNFTAFFLLIYSNNIYLLIIAMIFNGLGRAFSSGSLDALVIDQTLSLKGEEYLPKITTRLAVLEGSGIALGCIVGGVLATAWGTHKINLVLRLIMLAIVFILCVVYIKENSLKKEKEKTSLTIHLKQGKEIVFSNHILSSVILGVFFVGLFLTTIETYWQPAFKEITTFENIDWLLGIITFLSFLGVIIGNTISQKLLNRFKKKHWSIYLMSRGLLTVCILIFAIQDRSGGFIMGYIGVYLILGISNVAESTLMNQYTPNHMRASVLSLYSFISQIGVMCASLISSLLIKGLHFSGIWIVMGCSLGGYVLLATLVASRKPKV